MRRHRRRPRENEGNEENAAPKALPVPCGGRAHGTLSSVAWAATKVSYGHAAKGARGDVLRQGCCGVTVGVRQVHICRDLRNTGLKGEYISNWAE
eukprot:gene24385-biopygen17916